MSEAAKDKDPDSIQDRSCFINSGSPRRGFMAYQSRGTALPLINRLQHDDADQLAYPQANYNVLQDFVRSSQPWSRERVRLPRRLRWTLWSMIPLELLWGIWLAITLTGTRPCGGPFCTVATLNHHAGLLLIFVVICLIGLAALVPATRGFSRCNGREVIGVTVAATAGGAALLGIAAVIIAALVVLIIVATFVLALTATS